MKKSLFIVCSLMLLLFVACSKDDGTPGPIGTEGSIVSENGLTTITGSGNYSFRMAYENSGYIVTYKEKEIDVLIDYSIWIEYLQSWISMIPSMSESLNPISGYYETMDMTGFIDSDSADYKIEAEGEYIIEYKKLPLTIAPDALPKTYSGAGRVVYGPFALTNSATFVIQCEDASGVGFSVELYDAYGEELFDSEYHSLYINYVESTFINEIDETIVKSDLTEGNYFIKVDASSNSDFSVTITN